TQVAAEYFRLFLVIAGWLGGLLGFSAGMLALGVWLVSLKSYGLPFLSPIAPRTYSKQPAILRGNVTQHSRATDYTNPEEGLS
ncbi:MAG TPA: spore germination protein, partial [Clostridia bacterium]|nr:spore germination protein [Clostridia bacterium]